MEYFSPPPFIFAYFPSLFLKGKIFFPYVPFSISSLVWFIFPPSIPTLLLLFSSGICLLFFFRKTANFLPCSEGGLIFFPPLEGGENGGLYTPARLLKWFQMDISCLLTWTL